MKKILVVGQTPPPYHGQAISTQRLLDGKYTSIQLYAVRMQFSGEIDEVGKFKIGKLIHLLKIIYQIRIARKKYKVDILYYMPVGANWIPLIRDLIILLSSRSLFRKTIFHFRSGNVYNLYPHLNVFLKYLYRKAYFFPDLSIKLSQYNPADDIALKSKKSIIVPNGVEDYYSQHQHLSKIQQELPVILFVGAIMESKGIYELLEIARLLHEKQLAFMLRIVGKTDSADTEDTIKRFITQHGLHHKVELRGVKVGEDKWQEYANADIFCFPSHFETFGLVLIEAMQFNLPVVATNIGGMRSVVADGESGFLIPLKDYTAFASKIELLLQDKALRENMGRRGRKIFLDNFTVEQYWKNMENALSSEY